MIFGAFSLDQADGIILAHTVRTAARTYHKGHVVTRADCDALRSAGITEVTGARLEAGDITEDVAAARLAERLAGENTAPSLARTGRCNIVAKADGLVCLDSATILAANLVSETVTIATLGHQQAAKAGQIVATVKVIPFAVREDVLTQIEGILKTPSLDVALFRDKSYALISTLKPDMKPSILTATEDITRQRVINIGGRLVATTRAAHKTADVRQSIDETLATKPDVLLIAGASATADRGDVVPVAITQAGGVIDHFGMPVDPGNLLVIGHIGETPVLVMPGCARSPKLNGVDWVMQRLAAGVPVGARDIMAMGVGGLLVDTPSRPLPREKAVQSSFSTKAPIAAIILAAGQSRRMGDGNKRLMEIDGKPLIRKTVETFRAAVSGPLIVVTGHQEEMVREVLAGLDVTLIHNPHYGEGLSTSLRTGLAAVPANVAGAIVGLGDMPAVAPQHIQRLMAAFDPEGGKAIGVPMHNGKRGNPVLWARRFFAEMSTMAGDTGAKALIGANESLVYEVEFEDTAVLTDLDTPEQWSDFLAKRRS